MYSHFKVHFKRNSSNAFKLFFIHFLTMLFYSLSVFGNKDTIVYIDSPVVCLGNGSFGQKISFRSQKGLKWRIFESNNIFDSLSNQAFVGGDNGMLLREDSLSATQSSYSIYGKFNSGRDFSLTFINGYGDYSKYTGGGKTSTSFSVSGSIATCLSAQERYSAPAYSSGYNVMVTGGIISESNLDSSSLKVLWGTVPGVYTITFSKKNDSCSLPSVLQIAVGNSSSQLACKSIVNIAADEQCQVPLTPNLISANPIALGEPYVLKLTSDNTTVIGNRITSDLIGKTLTAQLIQGCSQNSCWGLVKIEDKTAPKVLCIDTFVVNCYDTINFTPFAIDNCNEVQKVILVDSLSTPTPCNKLYSHIITKTYKAIDQSNNISEPCTQTIALKRLSLDSISFPSDITMTSALACNNFNKDNNGRPNPDVTGYPTYNCMDIYQSFAPICNIYSSYEDVAVGFTGCVEKIMRTWTLLEWRCDSSAVRRHTQVIHISDYIAPEFVCPPAKTVSTNSDNCSATVELDAITNVKDVCSTVFSYGISYDDFGITTNGGNVTLKTGTTSIIYKVSDQCGNYSTCVTSVTVLDATAPIVVCNNDITIGINADGVGHVNAAVIDNGSYDFCGLDSMKIKKMDSLSFNEEIWFDCRDVASSIMVELKVWNKAGLSNSCMTRVIIQDKNPPQIFCPIDTVITCETIYNLNNLSQYGVAKGSDACDFRIKETTKEKLNQCRVGHIERVFTIYDRQDSTSCSSFIRIEKSNNNFTVAWPKDYSLMDQCNLTNLVPDSLPNGFRRPVVTAEGLCDLFGATYEDRSFQIEEGGGSCFKIVRTWTLMDYCRKDEKGYEPAVHQQVIKVSNTIDPILSIKADTSSCTLDNNCEIGRISLTASASDECTPAENLEWRYIIDYNFNTTFVADTSVYATGASINASGNYPVGKHRILFSVEDKCGNLVSRSHDFEIKNCKAPTAVCINKVSAALTEMIVNGQKERMVCLDAKSLNASSTHFCDFPIRYSFSRDAKDTTKCFTCADIGVNKVTLFVLDNNGNFTTCVVDAEIQKNDNAELIITPSKNQLCIGDSVVLTAEAKNMVADKYTWSNGATGPTITVKPIVTTSYTVSVSGNEECILSKTFSVNVLPRINVLINDNASATQNVCAGDTTSLTASGGISYRWSNGQTGATIRVNPAMNTLYSITVTDVNGCTMAGSKRLDIVPLPIGSVNSPVDQICPGESTLLTATGGSIYNWSNGVTTPTNNVIPTISTVYSVTITQNGCSVVRSKEIILKQTPTIVLAGPQVICAGDTISLTASNSASSTSNSFLWSNNQSTPSISVTPTSTANNYSVTVTNAVGCSAVRATAITVNPLPIVAISPDNPGVCPGEGARLTASGGSTYAWNTNPVQSSPSITVSPTTPTTYTVSVTTTLGCSATGSKQVVISSTPIAVIAPISTAPICQGTPIQLTASGGLTYRWNSNPEQTSAVLNLTPASTTTFIVTVTNANNCTDTASQRITVIPTDFASISPLTLPRVCVGSSVTLTAAGGGTYRWSNNALTPAITVTPTANTTYSVTVTNSGCVSSTSRLVELEPLPVALITGNRSICLGGFTTLTATNLVNPNGNIYSWSNSANTPSITVIPTETSTYTVTILNNSCGGDNNIVSATVTVNPPVVATIAGVAEVCNGQSTTLTASGGTIYRWNTTPAQTTASITVSPPTATVYTVTVSTGPGCSASSSRTVTVCPSNVFKLQGKIETESQVPIKEVEVNLQNIDMHSTNENGQYEFPEMRIAENYMVKPAKDNAFLDGVSTLDLVMIQRHILGISRLNSPYKLIAADITNDKKVTISDLVELRKVILGQKEKFDGNTSWKFIDSEYKFSNPQDPLSADYPLFKEFIKPSGLNKADFIGIKIGDVNNSFTNNATNENREYAITLSDKNNTLAVSVENIKYIDGLQLAFNMDNAEDINITSSIFDQDELNYSANENKLIVSIATKRSIDVSNKELFTIAGKKNGTINVELSKTGINDELYMNGEAFPIEMPKSPIDKKDQIIIGNVPNPWSVVTSINFDLNGDEEVRINIKDLQGKLLHTKIIEGKEGANKVDVRAEHIQNVNGVLLYELITKNEKIAGKMMHID